MAFDKCLSGAKYQAAIQKDIDEGARLGVTGTPAFFINGRILAQLPQLLTVKKISGKRLPKILAISGGAVKPGGDFRRFRM